MGEANLSAWRPSFDTTLIAVVYSGLFGLSLANVVHAWRLYMKGPLYIASFRPLSVSIAAVMGFILLGDALYLGRGQCCSWGLYMKGPLYIASFRPLSIAIAAVMGFILLGDALYLGSVIGAVIICMGFYGVLWGKVNEEDSSFVAVESKTPLLQTAEP